MAKYIQCDKCGTLLRVEDNTWRPISIYNCDEKGVCDEYGNITWRNVTGPKRITKDLCFGCWVNFNTKINNYFKE